jgi:hypothetical protein
MAADGGMDASTIPPEMSSAPTPSRFSVVHLERRDTACLLNNVRTWWCGGNGCTELASLHLTDVDYPTNSPSWIES